MELESHRLFISLRNSLFASTIPVSPCMGSMIIAAVLSEIKSHHAGLLESIANEKELSKENDDKLKSILDGFVDKFINN